jgi:hypothetical protein
MRPTKISAWPRTWLTNQCSAFQKRTVATVRKGSIPEIGPPSAANGPKAGIRPYAVVAIIVGARSPF